MLIPAIPVAGYLAERLQRPNPFLVGALAAALKSRGVDGCAFTWLQKLSAKQ